MQSSHHVISLSEMVVITPPMPWRGIRGHGLCTCAPFVGYVVLIEIAYFGDDEEDVSVGSVLLVILCCG